MDTSSKLQLLSDTFNSTLATYQQTYQEYINTIDSSDNTLMVVPESAYIGKSNIGITANSTVDNCLSLCGTNPSCSGATFNTETTNCILSSGYGNVIKSKKTDSIVQKAVMYSYLLQNLNQKLMDINSQMSQIIKESYSQYQNNIKEKEAKEQLLQNNYNILIQERNQIDEMVRQFETINSAYDNGTINLNSNYYSYISLLLITILLVFLLIRFSFTGEQLGGGIKNFKGESLFLFLIMVIFLGLSKVYNNYNIYMFVAILLISYIISRTKQIFISK